MSNLTIFNFEHSQIQTIIENNEIFCRATQLAELLEYSNPHKAIKDHVDPDDLTKREVIDTIRRKQRVLFVNESGMYSLVLGSKLPSAKKVKRWVTSEVLPQIRKTGKYSLQNQQQNLPLAEVDADEEAIRIIANLYHSLHEAYELGAKLRTQYRHIAKDIDRHIGGHYLYNLNEPTVTALEKARQYAQAKSERIMFIKGMLSLLEEQPQPKRLANF